MNTIGLIFADFVMNPIGGPSQLATPVAGQPIIQRTLRRFAAIEGLAGRYLVVRSRDHAAAENAIRAADVADRVRLLPEDPGERLRGELLRTARKWALESWRGQVLGATWYDEFVDPRVVAALRDQFEADAVICFEGHQPVLDTKLAADMVAHHQRERELAPHVFTQAPPGLSGLLLTKPVLDRLLELNIPYGLLLSYRPEMAQYDPIIQPACYTVPVSVSHATGRVTGDTRRSREQLEGLLADLGEDCSAEQICTWLRREDHGRAGTLPVEVELELTTADPLPETRLRPRGARVPTRSLDDLDALDRLLRELAEYDDRLLVLGGHGDPLLHPEFAEVCRRVRLAGIFGLAVATPLVDLPPAGFDALFSVPVDVVEVMIDAASPETYEQVHGRGAYTQVLTNVERLEQRRRDQGTPRPIVVCSLTRAEPTIEEMEAFYDGWIRRVGTAVIRGYNDYCGLLPPDGLLPTVPPRRKPCQRLGSRLALLADGTAPACGQDLRGEMRLGDWRTGSLQEIWAGPERGRLQAAHRELALAEYPSCSRCTEWFRP